MKLNWNFLGEGGCKTKNLPWGEYGYFLELHIITKEQDFFCPRLLACTCNVCYSDAVQMQYIDTGSDAVAAMLMYSQQKVMIESLGIGCIVTP